tara:strand:+ start:8188 stop:9258 length:1071 start_codon:yes stop_codon:yes gene_type:complete
MNDFEINDKRTESEFKGITFSKYKKTDVKKQLIDSLYNGKIEESCYWSAEYICCGCFIDLWDIILNYVGKNIHLGNPKLPIYLELRFTTFKDIMSGGYNGNEISLRNSDKIRKLFAEIISIVCTSHKRHSIESIKIKRKEEFDMAYMGSKLKAPTIDYGQNVFKKDDPNELFISINEFTYHISCDSKNSLEACYWLEWIMEFENICKKRKQTCICERRSNIHVEDKYQKEPIWIIWDALLYTNSLLNDKISTKILNSLLTLYCVRYTPGVKKKRKYLLYFAISILTEVYNQKIEIINDKSLVDNIVKKIDMVYKEIKKNEIKSDTDYLFNGLEKTNREKTIEKLEMFSNMNTIVRK